MIFLCKKLPLANKQKRTTKAPKDLVGKNPSNSSYFEAKSFYLDILQSSLM
jgi:hypothetical protein